MGALCCSDNIHLPRSDFNKNEQIPAGADGGEPVVPAAAAGPAATAAAAEAATNTGAEAAAAAAALAPAEEDKFVSTVGELPKFDKAPQGKHSDDASECSSIQEEQLSQTVDGLSDQERSKQAKTIIKTFVKTMVKGTKMNVMTGSGALKSCTVSLSRDLQVLKIKAGGQTRPVPLKDLEEIVAGAEVASVATPLDELCATLVSSSGDCISFRLPDLNERDTFVMCLLMFTQKAQQDNEGSSLVSAG